MRDFLSAVFTFAVVIGYSFGPFFGLWAAFQNGAFWHAVGSIALPYYGIVYWFVA
jgi:hypothetical protein